MQVTKEERGNKGAALTTYLSLAGRYSVLMPNTARGGGISRKITNMPDRKRLKKIAGDLEVPQGMGVILRTAGAARTPAEIQRDFEYLMRLWENVRTLTLESTAPCLVYEEGSLIKRSIRDLYDKDTSEILVAGEAGYREAKDFMKMLMPSHARNVKRYKDKVPIFARMGVEAQLDAMLQPQVTLKSGGYLVINQTEALVAIDVNSGKSTRQHSVEETAIQTNLEAADEVARQLRLRDLAGLIVIDFIDMDNRGNVRKVEQRLKDALKDDRARIQVGRISHFGLMEMSRQRMRSSVLESTTQVCPHCEGLGYVRASSSVVLQVLRALEEHLNKSSRNDLTVKVTTQTALFMLNSKRESLADLEERFGVEITVEIDNHMGNVPCMIERGEQATRTPSAAPIQVDHADDAEDDEPVEEQVREEPEAEAAPTQNEQPDDDGEPKKRRKRRRRRGKRSDDEQMSDEAEVQSGNAESATSSDDEASAHAEPEQEKTVPNDASASRRTTRSRRTKAAPKRPEPIAEETERCNPSLLRNRSANRGAIRAGSKRTTRLRARRLSKRRPNQPRPKRQARKRRSRKAGGRAASFPMGYDNPAAVVRFPHRPPQETSGRSIWIFAQPSRLRRANRWRLPPFSSKARRLARFWWKSRPPAFAIRTSSPGPVRTRRASFRPF